MRKSASRTAWTACSRSSASEKVATRKLLGIGHHPLIFDLFAAKGHLVRPMRNHPFDLPHRNHGQETDEHQEAGKEESKTADKNSDIEDCRIKHSPARRQEGAMQ